MSGPPPTLGRPDWKKGRTAAREDHLRHRRCRREVRVEGLETLDYLDNLQSKNRCTEQGDAVVFESEVDKVYLSAPPKIVIIDHEKKRTFVLRKEGLPDVVVWNPWDKKAKAMPDFGDEEYKSMPGEEWIGRQEISAVPSSYSSGQLDPELICRMHTI
ncbi:putative glucose-6-phosphate 1-epimerase [Miscanthus floridulus]|uniref:putative glucose-6-phosphate 1-epimerase n=1 Tax=Miscanthus floridulus TaxID=154761 RepID=UPI00345B0ED3